MSDPTEVDEIEELGIVPDPDSSTPVSQTIGDDFEDGVDDDPA